MSGEFGVPVWPRDVLVDAPDAVFAVEIFEELRHEYRGRITVPMSVGARCFHALLVRFPKEWAR